MSERVTTGPDGLISIELDEHERRFLRELVAMLRGVDRTPDDPAHQRLNVPPYLGNHEAPEEWTRLIREQVQDGRRHDRDVMSKVLTSESPVRVDVDDALSFLRVVNEARLALAARLGVEVPEDYEELDVGSTIALHFLGILLEDITDVLGHSLG